MLPPGVAQIHPRFRTPVRMTVITGLIVAVFAAILPLTDLLTLVNIGTLVGIRDRLRRRARVARRQPDCRRAPSARRCCRSSRLPARRRASTSSRGCRSATWIRYGGLVRRRNPSSTRSTASGTRSCASSWPRSPRGDRENCNLSSRRAVLKARTLGRRAHVTLQHRGLRPFRTRYRASREGRTFLCRGYRRRAERYAQAPSLKVSLRRDRLGAFRRDHSSAGILSDPSRDRDSRRLGLADRSVARRAASISWSWAAAARSKRAC